ncbi:MAG: PilN domain-containing protein [Candidatus Rokuibacteriota bacterium]
MMPARIGVFVRDGRITVVALTGRAGLQHFVVEEAEDLPRTLAAELRTRGLAGGRLRVGLDRRLVIVKAIELPRADGGDAARMIGFDLERHVPFPPEDTRFDWIELPSDRAETRRVLVIAAESRTVDRPLALLAGAQRRPAALTVACHGLPGLLPRALPSRRVIWVHRHDTVADLLFLDGRTLLTSRRIAAADVAELARELRRSLPVVRWTGSDDVWLTGDEAPAWQAGLFAALDIPVCAPPFPASVLPLIAALPADNQGAGLLALAVAAGPRSPALNLLPGPARPWTPSRAQLVTAGMVLVTALLGLGLALVHVVKTERYLERVSDEIRRLEPEAKAVDRLAEELARKRRVLAALTGVEAGRVQALPVLRELTETLPAGAWLQALAMDRGGVELTGQADGASALIPLLEASGRLERVEFTSPVTKTQSKEQFRIRAAWEMPQVAHLPAPHLPAPHPALSPEGREFTGGFTLAPSGGEGRVRGSEVRGSEVRGR